MRKGDVNSPASYKPLLRELFDDMKVDISLPNIHAFLFKAGKNSISVQMSRGEMLNLTASPSVVLITCYRQMGIESSDLEVHSSRLDGIGMLKGGLGFLMNVKSSRPNPVKDSDVVILVALGGISLAEVKMLEDVLAESDVQVSRVLRFFFREFEQCAFPSAA